MKRILVISLVLALILSLALPSVAMAAKPTQVSATGQMTGITPGDVRELGHTGKWLVKDREIEGFMTDGFLNPLDVPYVPFTITYGGIFKLETQEGFLAGKMVCGGATFTISGKTAPSSIEEFQGTDWWCVTTTGHWTGLKGVKATGTFTAKVYYTDDNGHLGSIVAGFLFMDGKTKK